MASSVEGRAALRELCERYNTKYVGLHLMHVPSLTVNGDDATARLHFEFTASSRPGITPSVGARTTATTTSPTAASMADGS